MKLPDSNVLIYAVHAGAPQPSTAANWLVQAFDSGAGVALSWTALLGFVRPTPRAGVFEKPLPVEEALRAIDGWLSHPQARVLAPSVRHAALLGRLLLGAGTAGNLTTDAHLAALAIEPGATLGSFDRDFSRFAGLDFELLTP